MVLAVDDDPIFLRLVGFALADSQFQVVLAPNVAAARAELDKQGPEAFACVLIDYAMPGEDGLSLLRWLREYCPDLSTIMITAMWEKRLVEETVREGVTEFLDKPISPVEIARVVERAAEITGQRRELAEMRRQVEEAGRMRRITMDLGLSPMATTCFC